MFGSTARICEHTFLSRLIDQNSVVLDFGAFDGDFASAIIERFHCRVLSAEPVKELLERIQPQPLHRVLPVAIGGRNQMIEINIFNSGSSDAYGAIFANQGASPQAAEMVTLSEFCRRTAIDRIDLLKVDIEGAKIDMFEHCSDTDLQSAIQITTEFHDFVYPEQTHAVGRVRERMSDLGFWVLPFSLDNTDVLFLNRRSGVSAPEVAYLRSVVRCGKGIVRRLRRIAS
jgi:FkbM family methyltransferase